MFMIKWKMITWTHLEWVSKFGDIFNEHIYISCYVSLRALWIDLNIGANTNWSWSRISTDSSSEDFWKRISFSRRSWSERIIRVNFIDWSEWIRDKLLAAQKCLRISVRLVWNVFKSCLILVGTRRSKNVDDNKGYSIWNNQ